jgi:hypothetical protein
VSAPLQAFVFSSYLLNVLLQLANKEWDSKQTKKKLYDADTTPPCSAVHRIPELEPSYV